MAEVGCYLTADFSSNLIAKSTARERLNNQFLWKLNFNAVNQIMRYVLLYLLYNGLASKFNKQAKA